MVDFADIEQGGGIVVPSAPERGQGITADYLKGTTAAVQALAAQISPPSQVLDAPDKNQYGQAGTTSALGVDWQPSTSYAPGALVTVNTWWGLMRHMSTVTRTSEALLNANEGKHWQTVYGAVKVFKVESEDLGHLVCRDIDLSTGLGTGDTYHVSKPLPLQGWIATRTVASENHSITPPYGTGTIVGMWAAPTPYGAGNQGSLTPSGWFDLNISARFWGEI